METFSETQIQAALRLLSTEKPLKDALGNFVTLCTDGENLLCAETVEYVVIV